MRAIYSIATLLVLSASQSANAQAMSLRGIRADAYGGIDRFYSEGVNDNSFAYGASLGVDAFLGRNLVMGIEGTFLNSHAKNTTADTLGSTTRQSYGEWGAALRAGIMSSPSTLVYVKGGIVSNKQRITFDPLAPVTPSSTFHDRYRGYVLGGGIEQLIGEHFYLKAEGRYANYKSGSSRITGLLGLGVLLGPSAESVMMVPPPPPPPPIPVAPATQTCRDGSVILATDMCPATPEVAPPPPPPVPERG